MGFIKGVLKFVLSNLFILFLVAFVLSTSFYSSLESGYLKGQMKTFLITQPGFSDSLDTLYDSSRLYFFTLNQTKNITPETGDMPFEFVITKQDANLTKDEFKDKILGTMADAMYNTPIETPFGKLSLGDLALKLLGYRKLCLILSIVCGALLFVLFSGRFVLLGIDFLIASVFYYPMKFVFSTVLGRISQSLPSQVAGQTQVFIGSIISKTVEVSSTYFFYFFIAGIILVAIGILAKFLGIGLWLQSFFEKKAAKK